MDRGAAPPPAPRVLPAPYRRSVMVGRNILTILGIVFSSIGIPFLVVGGIVAVAAARGTFVLAIVFGSLGVMFAAIGVPMLLTGLGRGRQKLAALEHGAAAEGELVSVELNTSVRINGRSPWAIEYSFPAGGTVVRGTAQSFSRHDGERKAGDRVWVVYLPADPGTSTLWPPVG